MFPPAPYNYTALVEYCAQRWNATPDPLYIPTKYNISTGSRIMCVARRHTYAQLLSRSV